MKKEISPAMVGVVIAVVVVVLGLFLYRQVVATPPSAHPQMSFGNTGAPNTPAGGQSAGGATPAAGSGK